MCAYPKGFRKKIDFTRKKVGFDKRQEILDDIDYKGTYLPKGVMYEDMDKSFFDFIENDMKIVIDGKRVPVIVLTIQRWAEFSKTWQHSDKYKDIEIPFITIVRRPNTQVGRNQAGLYNIPGRPTYTYMKVPTFEGGRKGVDVYKIPQPTSVDITYEVRVFCNRMRDLNKFNVKIQQEFNSIQRYINVNGHPMPLILGDIGDESNIEDFENRRYYIQPYEITLLGYILVEDDFEVIPTINRSLLVTELVESDKRLPKLFIKQKGDGGDLNWNFQFIRNSVETITFTNTEDVKIFNIINLVNISNVKILINDVEKFNGLNLNKSLLINSNDEVTITISRIEPNDSYLSIDGVLR